MVYPKIAICPICGKRTYLRIQVGGYLRKYPIRVHCINCHALIKGEFIMDIPGKRGGLFLQNAKIEECDSDSTTMTVKNADYVIDISGELPCKKVRTFDGKMITSSPFLEASDKVDIRDRISRLEYFDSNIEEWEKWKSIAFQLLSDGGLDYIPMALRNQMGDFPYPCDNYLKALHCLQEVVHEETKNLFSPDTQDSCIKALLLSLATVDREKLHQFVTKIGGTDEILSSYRKIINVFASFMEIYPNILPAETYMRYTEKDSAHYGIATCSFVDIKSFYQDAYEALLSLLYIPTCIDNIIVRGEYDHFHSEFDYTFGKRRYASLENDFERYLALDNGYKFDKIQLSDPLQNSLHIPANKDVRNGIGHNNIRYDGLSQLISVPDMKNPELIKKELYLIDMAVDCIGLVRSCIILSEILLFVLRQETQPQLLRSIMHPRFYKNAEPNSKCPCGSNRKYKKCCKIDIDSVLR